MEPFQRFVEPSARVLRGHDATLRRRPSRVIGPRADPGGAWVLGPRADRPYRYALGSKGIPDGFAEARWEA
ncbi:hypothetical protein GCM10018783_23270 [Streptomyces griseosporeus]|nr:hypothetical protein GCM10018783_23270 [Streptomyces griseosporeus]